MGEAVEDLLVASNEAFKGRHELFVGFDSLDLEEEAINEDLVHACALSSSNDLGLVGKILGESDRRLLVHDIMIARCQDSKPKLLAYAGGLSGVPAKAAAI